MNLKKVPTPVPPPAPEWRKADKPGFEVNAKGQLRTTHPPPPAPDVFQGLNPIDPLTGDTIC